jgi:DNA-binding beta-propeller fold protein YncE
MNKSHYLPKAGLLALTIWVSHSVLAETYLTTPQPTILFSVNDGEAPNLIEEGPDAAVPADSVTVVRLYPDRPPTYQTRAGTTNSTIVGTPYAATIGRFGIVTNHTFREGAQVRPGDVRGLNQIAVVDLLSEDLAVTDRIATETGVWQAVVHPDGRRVIVALEDHIRVFTLTDKGKLEDLARTPTLGAAWSFALSPDGKTILAAILSDFVDWHGDIVRYELNRDGTLSGPTAIDSNGHVVEGPFAPRFAPDGKSALVLNGWGEPKGAMDDVLLVDMDANRVIAVVSQVGDGLESLAYHPSGDFAVIACLNSYGGTFSSQLAVIDLAAGTPQVLYHLPVERIPEGIEFDAAGTKLFVGTSHANQIAVFDVKGKMLNRLPFVLPTGYGPSVMGLITQ